MKSAVLGNFYSILGAFLYTGGVWCGLRLVPLLSLLDGRRISQLTWGSVPKLHTLEMQ